MGNTSPFALGAIVTSRQAISYEPNSDALTAPTVLLSAIVDFDILVQLDARTRIFFFGQLQANCATLFVESALTALNLFVESALTALKLFRFGSNLN
jgi:hypothetical protein